MKNLNTYFKLPILDGLELFNARNHKIDFPFHTHSTFNITLIFDQVFSTKLNTRYLQAPQGSIVITNPDEVHATICESRIGNSFFTFYLSPEVVTGLNGNKPVFFDDKIVYDTTAFQQLYYLSKNINNGEVNLEQKLQVVVKQLVDKYAKEALFSDKHTRLFQEFLKENMLEKFSLEKTARRFGLDKYKFLRLFKQETGLTPNNYIILKRIEKSKILLQNNDDLLGVAMEAGFYDATHFCKHFKKITGVTPGAYRNA